MPEVDKLEDLKKENESLKEKTTELEKALNTLIKRCKKWSLLCNLLMNKYITEEEEEQ